MLQPHTLSLGEEFDVRVINSFRDNSSLPLVIWCTSPQGDLGGRALQEGDDFRWTARIELWSWRAEYTCTMKWELKRKRFEAFKVSRDSNRCGITKKCSWSVREDGFYFSNIQPLCLVRTCATTQAPKQIQRRYLDYDVDPAVRGENDTNF
ncbi:hypothetical protein YC2023_005041 [Brassica napus]